MEYRFVDVGVVGGELCVSLAGSASPRAVFVMLHDSIGNGRIWDLVAARLPDDVAVIAPDLRGRGASSAVPGPFTVEQLLDDLDIVLDHFELDEVGVIGVGSGAHLAAGLRAVAPDLVSVSIGIETSSPGDPFDDFVRHRAATRSDWIEWAHRRLALGGWRLGAGAERFLAHGVTAMADGFGWRDDPAAVAAAHESQPLAAWPSHTRRIVVAPGEEPDLRSPVEPGGPLRLSEHTLLSVLLTADGADVIARALRSLLATG